MSFRKATKFFIGADLGKSRDYSAFAILERVESRGRYCGVRFAHEKTVELRLRHLERVPLGTRFTEVAERATKLAGQPGMHGAVELIVDATGVGSAVIEMLQPAGIPCPVIGVTITGGFRESASDGFHHVPKRNLMNGLQMALERDWLRISSRLPFAETLIKEMASMRLQIAPSGYERFEPWREGDHDDMVLAVALACWGAKRVYPHDMSGAPQYWDRPRNFLFGN